jgi:hypothetical protein
MVVGSPIATVPRLRATPSPTLHPQLLHLVQDEARMTVHGLPVDLHRNLTHPRGDHRPSAQRQDLSADLSRHSALSLANARHRSRADDYATSGGLPQIGS